MILRLFRALSLCLILFQAAFASAEFEVPSLSSPIIDQANMIDPQTEMSLRQSLLKLWQTEKTQIQVLTVESLQGLPIEQASIEIVDKWKLGGEEGDRGVLLLIARDERKIRIEVGQGLEGDLTDAHSKRIIDQAISPRFKTGDIAGGVLAGVSAIVEKTNPGYNIAGDVSTRPQVRDPRSRKKKSLGAKIFQGLFFLIMLILFIRNPILFLAIMAGGRGPGYRGGGGFGGGGGWSGGGGGFSGGGASGGW